MIEPEKLNYDLPIIFQNINIDENNVLTTRKCAIEWISIDELCEYPKEYEDTIDWKEHKGKDKIWITRGKLVIIVLGNFDELLKLWEYYLKEVKMVDEYQIPNSIRKAIREDGKKD